MGCERGLRGTSGKLTKPDLPLGHPGDNPANWPEHLQSAVQCFGGDVVHRAGLRAIGYPPNLTLSHSECSGRNFGHYLINFRDEKQGV